MTSKVHLVTGADGLVGRALIRKLAERGDQLIALDRSSGAVGATKVIDCDVRDVHRLYALAGRCQIDAVFHCGAYSGPMVARGNPHDLIAVNVMGTANLLELARNTGARRFVNCSSVAVYGSTLFGPVPEDSTLHPSTVYGASKLSAEALVTAFGKEHGLSVASLRLSWVYGPDRTTSCLLRRMIEDGLEGRATEVPWGASFFRQYIHADDAAAGLIAACDAGDLARSVFNLTGGDYRTLSDVAQLVGRLLPQANIALGGGSDPEDDVQHEFDITAARTLLGYVPRVSLEEGIRDFITTLKQRAEEKR